MTDLLVDHQPGWARLTLNRPEVRNVLNTALLKHIADELVVLSSQDSCRAVLICGAGGNFAAGADIGEIEHKSATEGKTDPRKGHWSDIRAFPKPLIAAVDGFCLGGGFELALMADMMVVGDSARIGLPETSLGLIPGAGGGQRLLGLVGRARAMRMVMMGEIIDAATAEAWGIAGWRADGAALPMAEKLADILATRAPLALAAAKKMLVTGSENADALDGERLAFEALLDSADKQEGIAAFRAKRKPDFKGK